MSCPADEILFGGARGGGKSDLIIGKWAAKAERYGEARGLMLRRTTGQLKALQERAMEVYGPKGLGWRWWARRGEWEAPSGAILTMTYLDRDSDAENYQGWNLTDIFVDEAGNFPSPIPIDKLKGTLRSSSGVPTQMVMTANPGGAGHGWLKRRYVDAGSPMSEIRSSYQCPITGKSLTTTRVYIPSRVADNKILLENDPMYVARLHEVGSEDLVRAWLEGDWDVSLGQFFPEWNDHVHVVPERAIPETWPRFCVMDWGFATPYDIQWWAVSDGSWLPKGATVCYRENYGREGSNDRGVRLTSSQVATLMLQLEQGERIDKRIADPNVFRTDNGPSIAEGFEDKRIYWHRADKERVSGWMEIHNRLKGTGYGTDDWTPYLYVMEQCRGLREAIPAMVHDEKNPEDALKVPGDHPADACRYFHKSRPFNRTVAQRKAENRMSLDYLMRHQKRTNDRILSY